MLGDEHTTQCFITVSTQLANAEASQNVSKALGLGRVVGDLLRRLVARLDAHCDRVSRKCPLRLVHAILKIVNTRISVLQKKYKKSASRRRSHRPQHHQSRPTRPGVNHSFHFVCTMVASARACQRRPLRKTRGDWNPTCFVGKPLQVQCKKSTLCVESTRLLVLCICAGLSQSFRLSTNVNIEKAAKIFPLAFGTIVFAPFGLLMWFRTTPTLLCNQESAPNLPFASLLFHTGGCKGWLDKKNWSCGTLRSMHAAECGLQVAASVHLWRGYGILECTPVLHILHPPAPNTCSLQVLALFAAVLCVAENNYCRSKI